MQCQTRIAAVLIVSLCLTVNVGAENLGLLPDDLMTSTTNDVSNAETSSGREPSVRLKSTFRRDSYEAVIEKQFPGFRILKPEDFDKFVRSDVRDGVSGSLVIGNFDYDKIKDFSALLIGELKDTSEIESTRSEKVYKGRWVVCHGSNDSSEYSCEELGKQDIYGLEYSVLSLIPPGLYECAYNAEGMKQIRTSIDGIGAYSEKAGSFFVMQRNGTYFNCADSD